VDLLISLGIPPINDLPEKLDFKHSGSHFAGPFVLYFSFGLLDAMFQSLVYWVIGALADDSKQVNQFRLIFAQVWCL